MSQLGPTTSCEPIRRASGVLQPGSWEGAQEGERRFFSGAENNGAAVWVQWELVRPECGQCRWQTALTYGVGSSPWACPQVDGGLP